MESTPKDSRVKDEMDSKFRYVLVVAERAEQLLRGARAKLDLPNVKPTRIAQEEIDQEMVEWGYGPAPEPELLLDLGAEGAAVAGIGEEGSDGSEPEAAEVH